MEKRQRRQRWCWLRQYATCYALCSDKVEKLSVFAWVSVSILVAKRNNMQHDESHAACYFPIKSVKYIIRVYVFVRPKLSHPFLTEMKRILLFNGITLPTTMQMFTFATCVVSWRWNYVARHNSHRRLPAVFIRKIVIIIICKESNYPNWMGAKSVFNLRWTSWTASHIFCLSVLNSLHIGPFGLSISLLSSCQNTVSGEDELAAFSQCGLRCIRKKVIICWSIVWSRAVSDEPWQCRHARCLSESLITYLRTALELVSSCRPETRIPNDVVRCAEAIK